MSISDAIPVWSALCEQSPAISRTEFPFGIFYSVEGNRILISAILALRQDPERIRERLEE